MGWLFGKALSLVFLPVDWLILKPLGWLTNTLIVKPIKWLITSVVKWILFDLQTYWILGFLGLMLLNTMVGLDLFAAIGMATAFGFGVAFLRSVLITINAEKCTKLQLRKINKVAEYSQALKRFEKLKSMNTRVKNAQDIDPLEPSILKYIHAPKSLVAYMIPEFRVGFYIAWTIAISLMWTTFGLSLEIMGAMTLSTIVGEVIFKSLMSGEVLANEKTLSQDIKELGNNIKNVNNESKILENENEHDTASQAIIKSEAQAVEQVRTGALKHYYQAQSSRREVSNTYTKFSELQVREVIMTERIYS